MPQSIFITTCPRCKHEFSTRKIKTQCGKCGKKFEVEKE